MGITAAGGSGVGAWIASLTGLPLSALAVLTALAVAIWGALDWRYKAQIESLEHRLKLRDDQVAAAAKRSAAPDQQLDHLPATNTKPIELKTSGLPVRRTAGAPHQVRPTKDRVFIDNQSAAELMRSFDHVLSRDLDAHVKRYLGKWLQVELLVEDIYVESNITYVFVKPPDEPGRFIWLHFEKDRDRLDLYERGQAINAVGCVRELSSLTLRLYACEVIPAA